MRSLRSSRAYKRALMLSALARLAPAPGICSLPSHDCLPTCATLAMASMMWITSSRSRRGMKRA
eukprot:1191394-Prorocentrum_minimum.AAC.1